MSILGGPELPPDDFSLDRHPGRGSLIPPIFGQTAKKIRMRVPQRNSKDAAFSGWIWRPISRRSAI